MKRERKTDNEIKRIMRGRAARILAAAVSAFLCAFTLFEYTALRMEWDIPLLAAISGGDGFWSAVYQKEELAFDESTENVLLESAEGLDAAEEENADAKDGGVKTPDDADGGRQSESGEPEAAEEENAEQPENAEQSETSRTDEASEGTGEPEENADESAESTDDAAETAKLPYYIRVNRKQNCITIYTQDDTGEYTVPYKAMICSTGLYNATPCGTYHISTKYLWRELYGGVYGQYATRICGGVLFHSVPYYSKSKNSLCTDKYNKLGQQASMGCVRLTVEDAKWIAENCPEGTTVEIYDDDDPGPLGKPEAVKIDTDNPNKGWDPTDPDEDNPWHELSQDE